MMSSSYLQLRPRWLLISTTGTRIRSCATTISCSRPLSTQSVAVDDATSEPPPAQEQQHGCRHRRPIYVAATRQHVGKTTTSLALMSGLQRRLAAENDALGKDKKIGFMKPVGQQCLEVLCRRTGEILYVDKDACLIKEHFGLHHIKYRHTSPVMIPPGYTKDYLDGKITLEEQRRKIETAAEHIMETSDVVLCEGTGHCAVGSIVDACNAQVASWLNAKMVLIGNGGIGNTLDELALNKALCDQYDVDIAGIIVNKVKPSKYEQTKYYLNKALQQPKWDGIPLIGCIPDRPFLGCPSLADLERLLGEDNASIVSGHDHRLRHYTVHDMNLVATSLDVFLKNLRQKQNPSRTLYVCHASRNDILLGFLMEAYSHHNNNANNHDSSSRGSMNPDPIQYHNEAAMVVTGCDESPVSTQVLEIIASLPPSAPPVLLANQPTQHVMEQVYAYTPKLNVDDENRVATAVDHYEPYIDFDLLLDRVTEGDSVADGVAGGQ